jgi:hypothetical protein
MKPWDWTIAGLALAAALFLACQTGSDAAPLQASDRAAPQASGVAAADEPAPQEKASPEKAPPKEAAEEKKAPEAEPEKRKEPASADESLFEANAFPPTVSDVDYHKDAWLKDDCMRCHETGVEDAPRTVHKDMPAVLLTAKCRSCHVQVRSAAIKGR